MSTLAESVTDVLAPVVASAGLALEEVDVATAGRRRVVRVVVDRAGDEPGDLDMDAVATVSQDVSTALDASDVLGTAEYTLEVTSPGVDRPLTTRRHWARNRGRLVRTVLTDGSALMLRVGAVDDEGVHGTLEPQMVKGKPPRAKDVGAPRDLAWDDLVRGEVQVEFRRADDPDEDAAADEDAVDDDAVDDDELHDDELDELDDEGREDER